MEGFARLIFLQSLFYSLLTIRIAIRNFYVLEIMLEPVGDIMGIIMLYEGAARE
jgi:hypothetical protein